MLRRFLLLLLALFMLQGCGSAPREDVCICAQGDTQYTLSMFRYTVAALKTRYLSDYYEEKGEIEQFEDIPALWEMEHTDGTSVGQALLDIAVTAAKTTVYFANFAKQKGLILTKNQLAAIRGNVAQTKSLFTDEDDFSDYLATFGLNEQTLEDYYTLEAYADAAQSYLYENGGASSVREEEARQYFDTRFATTQHIFLSYEAGWEQKRDAVQAALDNGGSLLDFKAYSDDDFFTAFPNGMLLYAGSTGFTEYENAALSLQIGEHCRLTDTDGIYILQRIQNDPAAFTAPLLENGTAVRELIITLLTDEKKRKAVAEATDLTFNLTAIKAVTVAASPLIH